MVDRLLRKEPSLRYQGRCVRVRIAVDSLLLACVKSQRFFLCCGFFGLSHRFPSTSRKVSPQDWTGTCELVN